MPSLTTVMHILLLVGSAYGCQITMTRAIYLKKASYIMPFGYISIIFATISDILLFGASFDLVSVFGMIMTSAGLMSKLLIKE